MIRARRLCPALDSLRFRMRLTFMMRLKTLLVALALTTLAGCSTATHNDAATIAGSWRLLQMSRTPVPASQVRGSDLVGGVAVRKWSGAQGEASQSLATYVDAIRCNSYNLRLRLFSCLCYESDYCQDYFATLLRVLLGGRSEPLCAWNLRYNILFKSAILPSEYHESD